MRLSSKTKQLFKALAQKNYGKLVKKQVQGKDGKTHTVWVDPNKNKPVKEKSKEEQIKERKQIKKKVENKQPKHSEEDLKKIKEITERHTRFEKEAKDQRKGYGSGPMVPKVGAIMRVYAKGKANVGGMLGKIKEIAKDGKSVIVQLTSGNFYSFGLQDLQFAKSSIYNMVQILKAKRRNDGETWQQPSGRWVTKKNGKIVPTKPEAKSKEATPAKSKTAQLDEIPLDKISTLLPKQMQEAKEIYAKVKDLPESELRTRLERLKKVPGKGKIPGVKAIEHALEKFNVPQAVKEQKEKVAKTVKETVKRTRKKKEVVDTPILPLAQEPEVSRGTNVKSNEILESSIVDNSEKENNFDTMPESEDEPKTVQEFMDLPNVANISDLSNNVKEILSRYSGKSMGVFQANRYLVENKELGYKLMESLGINSQEKLDSYLQKLHTKARSEKSKREKPQKEKTNKFFQDLEWAKVEDLIDRTIAEEKLKKQKIDFLKQENNFDTMPESEPVKPNSPMSKKSIIQKQNNDIVKTLQKVQNLEYRTTAVHNTIQKCLAALNLRASVNGGWYNPSAIQIKGLTGLYMLNKDGSIHFDARIIKESENSYKIEEMASSTYNQFEKEYRRLQENNFDTMPESEPEPITTPPEIKNKKLLMALHSLKENTNTINAVELGKAIQQLLLLNLTPKDKTYLERVKAVRDRLPAKQIEQIQNSIKAMDIKDKDFVISTIRNYITDSILKYGETAPLSIDKPAKTTKVQNKVIATKFRNLADGLDKRIDSLKNSAIGQQRSTWRRSSIAASMYERGEKLEKNQAALRGLADLWDKGEVPPELQSIRSISDVQFISSTYSNLKKYPKDDFDTMPWIRTNRIKDISDFLKGIDYQQRPLTEDYKKDYGGKLYDVKPEYLLKHGLIDKEFLKDSKEILDVIGRENPFKTTDQQLMKKIERVFAKFKLIEGRKIKLDSSGKPYFTQKTTNSNKFYNKEFAALGINSKEEFMQVAETLEKIVSGKYTPENPKEKQIKEKERNLLGSKIPGFFPTPRPIIDKAINRLDVEKGMKVLEPSAGKGDMADALKEQGADVDVIEPNSSLRDILALKEHKLIEHDIMDMPNDPIYDRILMNPPFEKGQDIDHTKKAYELLKPGGRMVAIVSEGPFFRSSNKDKEFREWLDSLETDIEKLPEGSFKNAFVSTGVNTRMIVIDKPSEPTSKPENKIDTFPESQPLIDKKGEKPQEERKEKAMRKAEQKHEWTNSRGDKFEFSAYLDYGLDNSGNRKADSKERRIEQEFKANGKTIQGWLKELDKNHPLYAKGARGTFGNYAIMEKDYSKMQEIFANLRNHPEYKEWQNIKNEWWKNEYEYEKHAKRIEEMSAMGDY